MPYFLENGEQITSLVNIQSRAKEYYGTLFLFPPEKYRAEGDALEAMIQESQVDAICPGACFTTKDVQAARWSLKSGKTCRTDRVVA